VPAGQVSAAPILIEGISKWFGAGSTQLTALNGVDLTVPAGQFVSILGPSGCGKSTLLMIVAGLVPASSGQVTVQGRLVTKPLTDVGIVFQQDLMFDWRTTLGNVMLQADIRGMPKKPAREKALSLLQLVGLGGFEDKRPWQLSGGMRQRAALCRALLHDANVLLLDEPFGALDALTRDQINVDLLKIWSEYRPTAVMVTHSISEAVFVSDRVVVMSSRPGRIILDLPIDLPRPRTPPMRDTADFIAYQAQLRAAIGH
jgi:NitT/TauT family transport system ATP-binding protein